MGYHLLRSYKLRSVVNKKGDKIYEIIKKLSLDTKYMDICKEILFLMYNSTRNIS